MMTPDDPRHGTRRGYDKHRRDGDTPCERCREAWAAYMRAHRERNGIPTTTRVYESARGRALTRLSHLYPEAFADIMREELAAVSAAVRSKKAAS